MRQGHKDKERFWSDGCVVVTAQSLWVPLKTSLGYPLSCTTQGKLISGYSFQGISQPAYKANGTHSSGQGKSLLSSRYRAPVNGTVVLGGAPSRMCQGTKNLSLTICGRLYPGKCILCQPYDSLLLPPNITKTCVTLPGSKEPISINLSWNR